MGIIIFLHLKVVTKSNKIPEQMQEKREESENFYNN
jgi:hypothetical protein